MAKAPEFSAATYRLFAGGARNQAAKNRYLNRAKMAYENPLPRKTGSGVITKIGGGDRWDYNAKGAGFTGATGKRNPGDSAGRVFPGQTTSVASASSAAAAPGGRGGFFGGTPKATLPAVRAQRQSSRASMKTAAGAYKSSIASARADLASGKITRKEFTAKQRAASRAKTSTVKAARSQMRAANIQQAKA